MTAGTDTKETVAAAGFAGFLALAFGPVGLLLAAIAIGVERAWDNGVGGGSAGSAASRRWSNSLAGHRAWLDWDRGQRARHAVARREWLASGGDPANAPVWPDAWQRFGLWLHRQWSRAAVSGSEFADGFGDGWAAAQKVRDDGGSFGDIATARPEVSPPPPDPAPQPARPVAEPVRPPVPQPEPQPIPIAVPDPGDSSPQSAIQPAPNEGAPMTTPTIQQGETHADLILVKLDGLGRWISQAEDLNDQASATASAIEAEVAEASEYSESKDATSATKQALDEAKGVASAIRETVARLADLCAQASESVGAATVGMRPAIDAQDGLHAAGARGNVVATATSD